MDIANELKRRKECNSGVVVGTREKTVPEMTYNVFSGC